MSDTLHDREVSGVIADEVFSDYERVVGKGRNSVFAAGLKAKVGKIRAIPTAARL